ncbi:hypothetical protein Tco_0880641 [Tanacetum coccineum]
MEQRVLSQKGSGVGRGVKEKQSLMADKSVKGLESFPTISEAHGIHSPVSANEEKINDVGTVNNVVNNGTKVGPTLASNTHGMSTSYVNVTGEPCRKAANSRTLITPAGNGVDIVVPMESIKAISEWNTWGKYGQVKSMLNSSTGLFSFQFNSMDGLDAMLENEDVSNVSVWVKLYGVPVTAFSEDFLSAIATKLALIEIRADVELKDNIVMAMPKLVMSTWKTFRGNTRDLGSILEETGQEYDFTPKEGLKNKSQMVETASGKLATPSGSASDGGLGEMLHKQRNDMHEQFSQIPSPLRAEYRPPILRNLPSPSLLDQGPPHVIYPTHLLHSHPQPMKRLKWKDPKIHINLPFHEVMIHMPKGAKVLKDLLSHKEKLKKASSSVKLSEECSTVIQRSFPQKEGDPGSFTLHCLTGPLTVKNALANLGASINLMPHSLFQKLRISELKPTRMILEMDEDELVPIILGRPFLATARAVIDVHEGKLSLKVGSKIAPENCPKPSISEPPKLELKEIAEHLEYDFLQGDDHLLVVISSTLSIYEKAKLLEVLRKHKGEIAWSVADIKGIDSSFCTHKILMEDEYKPTVQPQRRVNPNIKEVMKKQVIKLLDAGLIYPISDSP